MSFERLKPKVHLFLAWLAYWWYGRPAQKLIVIGVTGTKGKSTTCRLIASALEAGGHKVGLLSTVEFQIGERKWLNDKKMTMLGRGEIQRLLREMVQSGCRYVIVETSSEGILQYRHYGLLYDIAVFTNLGTEHSERHGGFDNLRRDKGKMFAALGAPAKKINSERIKKISIVNSDDVHSLYFMGFPAEEHWVFSLMHKPAKAGIKNIDGQLVESTGHGSQFTANGELYHLPLAGDFNVYNALAAIAVAQSQGVASSKIAQGFSRVTGVPGRMEFIDAGQPFKAIVDYAHEPISIRALFKTLRNIVKDDGKVIGIIGSDGGGRDIGKRSTMGEIAGTLADIVIVTDVNCFEEDPGQIAEMLAKGARTAGKKDGFDLFIEVDRRLAIRHALSFAKPGDVVVVTAKGTEQCIVVTKGRKIPWDDRTVMREELEALRKSARYEKTLFRGL